MTRLATLVLAAALLSACSSSDSPCQPCALLNNACVPVGECVPAQCSRPVVNSALPTDQVQKFGTLPVGREVSFNVPANTGSVTIVQQAQAANLTVVYKGSVIDNSAVPLTVKRPDGQTVYDDSTAGTSSSPDGGVDPSGDYAFYGGGTPSTSAFTFPNTSTSLSAGVPAGTWKFVVNDYANECTFLSGCTDGGTAADTYEVSVITRALPAGSTLEVAFYIVGDMNTLGGSALRAANAGSDSTVQRMVQTFKAVMSNAGITANVTFYDVSATERARFGTLTANSTGPCDELSQMFTISSAHPGNTMNLFLVQNLRVDSGNSSTTVIGIDSTIPGPASLNGTVHSGAVVSGADLFASTLQNCPSNGAVNIGGCGPDEVAFIAAHETGHFLGLFHTTEQEGADFDPLTDTLKCPCLSCASATDLPKCTSSSPPLITANRCNNGSTCGGGDNLMFWLLSPGVSRGTLSSQQAQVMRLNPAVH